VTVEEFAKKIAALCAVYKGSVISWGRTRKRNEMVGGHPASRHMKFLAVDIICDTREDRDRLYKAAYQSGLHGYKRRSATGMHLQDRSAKPPT